MTPKDKKDPGDKCFVKVTNKQIYDEVTQIRDLLETTIKSNETAHANLNGRANLNRYIALGAIGIATTVAVWLWELKGG